MIGCCDCGAFPICGAAYCILDPQSGVAPGNAINCANCTTYLTAEELAKYIRVPPPQAPELLSPSTSSMDKLTVNQGKVTEGKEEVSRSFGRPLPANLQKLGTDLTKIAAEDKLDPVVGRDQQTDQVIQILGRRSKSNACLVGEPGWVRLQLWRV